MIELRQGAGAFVADNGADQKTPTGCVPPRRRRRGRREAAARGVTDEEIRRLFEAELSGAIEPRRATVTDRA